MPAEKRSTKGMERAHADETRLGTANKSLQPCAHLVGSLVSKGNRAYSLWRDAVAEDEICDSGSKDPGLPAPRTRQDLQRNVGRMQHSCI